MNRRNFKNLTDPKLLSGSVCIYTYIHTYIHTHTHTHTHTYIYIYIYTYSQTKIYSDTFNISHIISLFAIVSKMVIKYDKNSDLNCQNKFILIMSDNFEKGIKVMNEVE